MHERKKQKKMKEYNTKLGLGGTVKFLKKFNWARNKMRVIKNKTSTNILYNTLKK